MEDLVTINKKKRDKIKRKKQLKQTKYGMILIQEISDTKIFQIPGDITLDLNQLLHKDSIQLISSWNAFLKVKQIKKSLQSKFIEVYLDTDVQTRSDIPLIIKLLKDSQSKELFDLANMIEEYQNVVQSKQLLQNLKIEQKMEQIIIKQEEDQSEEVCDEYHGWNFEKSAEKAEKIINDLINSMKDSDDHYTYLLLKGNKYDQIKSRLGYSTQILRNFLCLNDEQIEQLCLRKPIIINIKYKHQYTEYLFNRINNLVRALKQESSDLDYFRQSCNELNQLTFDLYSIDNLVVKVQYKQYLYVLSNYKNQMDDILYIGKCMPIRNQSASQILQGMRNLRKNLSEICQQNSYMNYLSYQLILNDQNYIKQSLNFVDKFYTIINNDIFSDILQNL
ncbi:hypothetical protein TTHERM_00753420 (macronuclear) [Tetrahymena thermophila SB210]|uniref:Uncharacterized protein n=1 Tax=Tetrahymena thermophila (strain SB210) TaxID=312017 RepID=Q23NH8_TETTS|nr:hypothetical protein TTHERM_00753420 [Tetrahymena thermophila SB210]EAR98096.2 hypothetical protein TTHERM_00753420 [Tetrahymena thermophila SB210]|eukprot:XP_001018341.2 hypothetical protein TTHERM_00753420 [Tetrahymena thermophila SB210]